MPTVPIIEGRAFTVEAWGSEESCQTQVFLARLQKKHPACFKRLLAIIGRCAENGPSMRPDVTRALQGYDGLFEWKTRGGARLFWFYGKERALIVCASGFMKKSQKTPKRELERAAGIRSAYMEEGDDEDK